MGREQVNLHIEAMADGGDFLWAVSSGSLNDLRILLKIWKGSQQTEIVSACWGMGRIAQMIIADEKVYLIPKGATRLASYNMLEKVWNYIRLEVPNTGIYNENAAFSFAELFGDWIYIFPEISSVIVRMNRKTNEIMYLHDFFYGFQRQDIWDRPQPVMELVERCGDMLIIYSPVYGLLVRIGFNTTEMQLSVIRKVPPKEFCRKVGYDGKNFWFVPSLKEIPIRKWNMEKEEMIPVKDVDIIYGRMPFYLVTFFQNKIWLFPGLADGVLSIDVTTNAIQKDSLFSPAVIEQRHGVEQFKYSCLCICENVLYIFDQTDRTLVYADGHIVKRCKVHIDAQTYTRLEIEGLFQKILENSNVSCINTEETNGRKIHEAVCNLITDKK